MQKGGNIVSGVTYTIKSCSATISVSEYISRYNNVEFFGGLCKQCPAYGKKWCCPPFDFSPLEKISHFKYAHIFGTQIFFPRDAIVQSRIEKNGDQVCRAAVEKVCKDNHSKLLEMREKNAPAVAFSVGCHLCPEGTCARGEGKVCRHPSKMLHSLESFGFDISKTASELLGIELLWSAGGVLPEYATVVTGLFTDNSKLL